MHTTHTHTHIHDQALGDFLFRSTTIPLPPTFQNVFKLADLQSAKLELLSKTYMADLEKELFTEMNPGKQPPQGKPLLRPQPHPCTAHGTARPCPPPPP